MKVSSKFLIQFLLIPRRLHSKDILWLIIRGFRRRWLFRTSFFVIHWWGRGRSNSLRWCNKKWQCKWKWGWGGRFNFANCLSEITNTHNNQTTCHWQNFIELGLSFGPRHEHLVCRVAQAAHTRSQQTIIPFASRICRGEIGMRWCRFVHPQGSFGSSKSDQNFPLLGLFTPESQIALGTASNGRPQWRASLSYLQHWGLDFNFHIFHKLSLQ